MVILAKHDRTYYYRNKETETETAIVQLQKMNCDRQHLSGGKHDPRHLFGGYPVKITDAKTNDP